MNYGNCFISFKIPDNNISILKPKELSPLINVNNSIIKSLRKPVEAKPLKDLITEKTRVALLVSDITRPCPSKKILPPLILELKKFGVSLNNITVFFATGTHREHMPEEKEKIIGTEVLKRIKTVDHNSQDKKKHCYLGRTRRGTEVFVNKQVINNDLIIGIANTDIHYFAGYSGGAKSLFPGIAAFESIQQNHALMLLPNSEPGKAEGNPVREDLEEAAQMTNFNFIVNVVLDDKKNIVEVVSGQYVKAHRLASKINDLMYKTPIGKKADIVIASAGGFPKDINLYQAQKGLDNARIAVKEGGTIIYIAECIDGIGNETLIKWLQEASHPDDVIERLRMRFVLGGHKAFAIAKVAKTAEIYLISSLAEKFIKMSFMKPTKKVEDALDQAFATHGKDASVALMSHAGSTLPSLQ